jgi:hypothetical protein
MLSPQPGPVFEAPHLANHLLRAAAGSEVDKAIVYAIRAGEQATALLAYNEAAGHYERAVQASELRRMANENERCELLLALGDSYWRAGDTAACRGAFESAARVARELGAAKQAARAAMGLAKLGSRLALPTGTQEDSEDQASYSTEDIAQTSPARSPFHAAGPQDAERLAVFRKEGEYWTIVYLGHRFHLKDNMGLGYLAQLLRCPGREFLAADLVANQWGHSAHSTADLPRSATTKGWSDGRPPGGLGNAGEILDREAKAAYKRRLDELRQELEEAKAFNDSDRATKAEAEIDFLVKELARGLGLCGRHRKAASHIERARMNVTRRIKAAQRKIAENNASLGRYLVTTVRTGTFCSYNPAPATQVSWVL